jgi:conjugal transfer pilin signal peptidase TrbI
MNDNSITPKEIWTNTKQILPLLLVILVLFAYFATRYSIAFNVAISDCLNSRIFLIDTWDKRIHENQLIAFQMNVETPYYDTGKVWVKKVAAYGPKTVNVTPDDVQTNEFTFDLSAHYVLGKIGQTPDQLISQWELKESEIFLIGETLTSLDSRFWGPIQDKDTVGRAYAIF